MSEERCCASCGIAEVDDIKLKECADCDLVRYCCDACQKNHKSHHEEDCKKRAAELHDEILFKQPESTHLGDCPICCLPMPLDLSKSTSTMMACCSTIICKGCNIANGMREAERKLTFKCPFCRTPIPDTDDGADEMIKKRMEANDPIAMLQEGIEQFKKGDCIRAFEYFTKAAELGDAEAHCQLAAMYSSGRGVEKDKGKEIYHWEEAAIGGHPTARYNLAIEEGDNGNIERAVRHLIIAANQGYDRAIKPLMNAFKMGLISKEELAAALRAHQAAVDATKSPQREAVEEYDQIEDNRNTEDC